MTEEPRAKRDARDLERLGYAQELLRGIGGFSNFAISFSVISILTGAVTLYGDALAKGGPLEMTLGWPLVTAGTLLVALSMAELCSALPTSGGMYHWSAELGGPTWAWFTAWFNIVGLVTALAGIDYGAAEFLVPILGLESKPATLLLVYGLLLVSHGLVNHYGIRWVAYLSDVSVTVHILGVAVLLGALWLFAPKQPLGFLLEARSFTPTRAPYVWLFMLGLLQAQWTYTGFDASAHVAEETVDPRHHAAWGMVTSVVVSGVFGYLLVLTLTWTIPDVAHVLSARDASQQPLPAVFAIVQMALGARAGTAVLGLTVLAMWFCGLATVTSLSRTFYAFARDKGMPLAELWSRISPRHQVPTAAIWLSVALAFAVLIYSGAYAVVTSLSVLGFYLSYIMPVYLGYRRRSLWISKRGPWHLSSYSNMMNLLACAWTVFICVIMLMPPNTLPCLGIAGGVGTLYVLHRLTGRHDVRKPVWERES